MDGLTTMALIAEIVLMAIIAVSAIKGLIDGFVKTALSLVGALGAVVGGYFLSKPAAEFVFNSWIRDSAVNAITKKIFSSVQNGGALSLFLNLQNKISQSELSAVSTEEQARALSETLVDGAFRSDIVGALRVAAFVLIAIVVLLVIGLIAKAAKGLNGLPLVGPVNKLLGLVAGAATGIVLCYVVVTLFSFLITLVNRDAADYTLTQLREGFIYGTLDKFKLMEYI